MSRTSTEVERHLNEWPQSPLSPSMCLAEVDRADALVQNRWARTMPGEALLRVFRYLEKNDQVSILRVCKSWHGPGRSALLRRANFTLFTAMPDEETVAAQYWRFASRPYGYEWKTFISTFAKDVRIFEDMYYSPAAVKISPSLFTGAFQCPSVIFPSLLALRVDLSLLRPPFLTHTIESLSLCISKPLMSHLLPHHHENLTVGSILLRTAPAFLINLRHLRLDGDETIEDFAGDLGVFISSLGSLETLEVTPFGLSEQVFVGLSSLPRFRSLHVLECGRDNDVLPGRLPALLLCHPVPELLPGAFRVVHGLSFTAWSPSMITQFIVQPYFPTSRIRRLWIKFSPGKQGSSNVEVRTLTRAFATMCTGLEDLTLRFASYGWDGYTEQATEALRYSDFEAIMLMPFLHSFAIDHTWPLLITPDDVRTIAKLASGFKVLLLNPYPTHSPDAEFAEVLPPLETLQYFAECCPHLEELGLLVSAMAPSGASPRAAFRNLRHLYVGWSWIPTFSHSPALYPQWQRIAFFLSSLVDRDAKLWTVYNTDEEEKDRPSEMVSPRLRARGRVFEDLDTEHQRRARAWSSVWAMRGFNRRVMTALSS